MAKFSVTIPPVFDKRHIREGLGGSSGHVAMIPLVQNIPGIYTDHRGENDQIALTLLDEREKLDFYHFKAQMDIAPYANTAGTLRLSTSA